MNRETEMEAVRAEARERAYVQRLRDAYAMGRWGQQVRPADPDLAAIYDRMAAIYAPLGT